MTYLSHLAATIIRLEAIKICAGKRRPVDLLLNENDLMDKMVLWERSGQFPFYKNFKVKI